MNRALQEILKRYPRRGDQALLAKELPLDQGYLSKVLREEKQASLEVRRRFFFHDRIPMEDWDFPPVEEGSNPTEVA